MATHHTTLYTSEATFDKTSPGQWIGTRASVQYPSRTPDNRLEGRVYSRNPPTLGKSWEANAKSCVATPVDTLAVDGNALDKY
jgi:hypothetical protein